MKIQYFRTSIRGLCLVMACAAATVHAQAPAQSAAPAAEEALEGKSKRNELENAWIKIVVIPRTAEQMKAFYEGRGFPQEAIAALAGACFMTVGIHNKTADVLWLELDNWWFTGAAQPQRLDRVYWNKHWDSLSVPKSSRSTFGWTLLPERRDLQAGEGVGGNITMKYSDQPFTLIATFARGEDKQQAPLSVQLNQLQCSR